jgi:hypothetical protein
MYKNKLPDVSLPPEHILTRWRTCDYTDLSYSDHSEDVNPFIDGLNSTDDVLFQQENTAWDNKTPQIYVSIIKSRFKIIV